MKLYQRIITGGLAIAGLAGLVGLYQKKELTTPHFAELPMYSNSGMGMTSGDFDRDGDLDLIVGARGIRSGAKLYKFNNDGKGNLQQPKSHFVELSMYSDSGMDMTSGDFDGDGDLDLIVGVRGIHGGAKLYKFNNDGKGNLSQ